LDKKEFYKVGLTKDKKEELEKRQKTLDLSFYYRFKVFSKDTVKLNFS